ncbi:MAG TPA: hypothetical protein VFC19_49370 [Candidatus Limnocylindrales bacterium]|nr:hypothetical protein [Candidatus Limnocylindrales bacterium]
MDEPGPAWRWCGECGHAYRTPGQLRRAYRRGLWNLLSRDQPWLRGDEFYPSILACLWDIVAVRAGRVTFCPLCSHDF